MLLETLWVGYLQHVRGPALCQAAPTNCLSEGRKIFRSLQKGFSGSGAVLTSSYFSVTSQDKLLGNVVLDLRWPLLEPGRRLEPRDTLLRRRSLESL